MSLGEREIEMKLVLKYIHKTFDKKEVIRGASYAFEKGRIYGLLGRNGAGKTTLFNCINEDIKMDSGEILLDALGEERPLAAEDIGYVLSTPLVPEFLTGREFLKFFLDINKEKITNMKSIDEYFQFMMIDEDDRDKLLKDYSHGMKNKMQMLINFIANPLVFLLDEPLTSFDVVVAEEIKALLRELKEEHIVILSTHIMELALDMCDDIVILNGGTLKKIERDELEEDAFKARIIKSLKEEEYA